MFTLAKPVCGTVSSASLIKHAMTNWRLRQMTRSYIDKSLWLRCNIWAGSNKFDCRNADGMRGKIGSMTAIIS